MNARWQRISIDDDLCYLLRNSAHNSRADDFCQPDGQLLPDGDDFVELATAGANIADGTFSQAVLPDRRMFFRSPLLFEFVCAAVVRTASKVEGPLPAFDAAFQTVPVHQHVTRRMIEFS